LPGEEAAADDLGDAIGVGAEEDVERDDDLHGRGRVPFEDGGEALRDRRLPAAAGCRVDVLVTCGARETGRPSRGVDVRTGGLIWRAIAPAGSGGHGRLPGTPTASGREDAVREQGQDRIRAQLVERALVAGRAGSSGDRVDAVHGRGD